MDDNSGNTDKRNWRERLGIGKTASAADMPKLASDFKPVGAEPTKVDQAASTDDKPVHRGVPHAPAKAAPMAPRTAAKPVAKATGTPPNPMAKSIAAAPTIPAPARPVTPRTQPLATDALANKLKDQRDAAERLALQRVQAAKQKAEATLNAGGATAKPKFSFADESAPTNAAAPSSSAQGARPAASPSYGATPTQPNAFSPQQIQPPRPQLGGGGFGAPPNFKPQGQGYVPQGGFQQQPFQQNYGFQQPPAYRPIDPNTGYAPPPVQPYMPPPMRQPSQPTAAQPAQRSPQTQPRVSGLEQRAPSAPRGPQVSLGPAVTRPSTSDDIFEPTPVRASGRRATANEYQQAYRDELGYEDDAPRSRILITLLSFLMLSIIVAIAAVYGWGYYVKNLHSATATNAVPVVSAPATPTKVTPDNTIQAGQSDTASKKQIYDRIEGDHEVPGGPLKSSEESPTIQPGAAKGIAPTGQAPKATGGTEGVPLPLPPPPGGGTGQQGSLTPDIKTDVANLTPAAEQSSAAISSTAPVDQTSVPPPGSQAALPMPEPPGSTPPPPSKIADAVEPSQSTTADKTKTATETIAALKPPATSPTPLASGTSQTEQVPAPTKKPDKLKKLVLGKSLGAKPLVLVPAAKSPANSRVKIANTAPTPIAITGGNSLYGDAGTQIAAVAPVKPTAPVVLNPTPKLVAPSPQPTPAGNGFVAQLASFNSKTEANAEYQRLSLKHGAIISRYAPIITQAQIAGSTRYKLNLGPMATNDAASSVCSALISAGERDCVVRHQ